MRLGLPVHHPGLLPDPANLGLDIVSISFGGYLDRSDPDQNAVYRAYAAVVKYARSKAP